MDRQHSFRLGLCSLGFAALVAVPPAAARDQTLGFAITRWTTAIYQTRFMDECPDGLNPGNDEIWWRGLKREERGPQTENGLITQVERMNKSNNRGPKGQDVCFAPTSVTDPPLKTIEGTVSYGADLDHVPDGQDSPKSCAHQNFVSPDGAHGIDNQLYRVLGCSYGWRSYGHLDVNANGQRLISGLGMILIEVRHVDDVHNDPDVEVAFYRSVDPFRLDSDGKVLPFLTYRVDAVDETPRYGNPVKGKIVDGVLTTEQADVTLPYYGNYHHTQNHVRAATLRLKLDADGAHANGDFSGYYDLEEMWAYIDTLGGAFSATAQFSCPQHYEALHRLADGFPDPKTGKCTAISSAFLVESAAAFIQRPTSKMAREK